MISSVPTPPVFSLTVCWRVANPLDNLVPVELRSTEAAVAPTVLAAWEAAAVTEAEKVFHEFILLLVGRTEG